MTGTKVRESRPWHESIVKELEYLAEAFDKNHSKADADNSRSMRLEAKAETLASLILGTKTPKDVDKVLAAWTKMQGATGLSEDYEVTEHLNAQL